MSAVAFSAPMARRHWRGIPSCCACPSRDPLSVVQPDDRRPTLGIGTCLDCGAMWILDGSDLHAIWAIAGRLLEADAVPRVVTAI